MSHNDNDTEREARRHNPAIIAIIVALVVAALAYFVFLPGTNEENEGIVTTAPPADTPVTDAEGRDGEAEVISPEGGAPVGEAPANN